MASSSSSVNSRIPKFCKCTVPQPLKLRTSWTITNPARRFLNCPDALIPWKRCKAYYWVDEEVNNAWYKMNLYELYQSLNRNQRDSYYEMMKYREMFTKMEDDFALYRSEMEGMVELLQNEVVDYKKKIKFYTKLTLFLAVIIVGMVCLG